jgi:hypothetical protein
MNGIDYSKIGPKRLSAELSRKRAISAVEVSGGPEPSVAGPAKPGIDRRRGEEKS